ncbi:hypothetical protein [Alkalihalobacillus pseudalcaliphilus]|uniref:AtuA-related protein n=1 Tax=Alkalihalobacillus pseudalcaliphilus TaxID=79884 RepID=UPI00064D80D0|nr:hypothetical protein [Alkalihalobacillus pseudalcaliphilus]KMK75166.1 hypothetical protein AB990_17135 [Alkalihalobacillus pseudalcaliphilus]
MVQSVPLFEIAHARSGDKGELTTLTLFAYQDQDYKLLQEQVTEEMIKKHFTSIGIQKIERYELPKIVALHFVLHKTRPNGVAATLEFDAHGKSLSWYALELEIELSE